MVGNRPQETPAPQEAPQPEQVYEAKAAFDPRRQAAEQASKGTPLEGLKKLAKQGVEKVGEVGKEAGKVLTTEMQKKIDAVKERSATKRYSLYGRTLQSATEAISFTVGKKNASRMENLAGFTPLHDSRKHFGLALEVGNEIIANPHMSSGQRVKGAMYAAGLGAWAAVEGVTDLVTLGAAAPLRKMFALGANEIGKAMGISLNENKMRNDLLRTNPKEVQMLDKVSKWMDKHANKEPATSKEAWDKFRAQAGYQEVNTQTA